MGATHARAAWKTFDFVRKLDSTSPRDFELALSQHGEAVATDPTCNKLLKRRAHNLVKTGDAAAFAPPSSYDAVVENWLENLEDLPILMHSSAFNSWPPVVDRGRSFSVLAREVPIFDPPDFYRNVQ